jgi:hypothetical protein
MKSLAAPLAGSELNSFLHKIINIETIQVSILANLHLAFCLDFYVDPSKQAYANGSAERLKHNRIGYY